MPGKEGKCVFAEVTEAVGGSGGREEADHTADRPGRGGVREERFWPGPAGRQK